MIRYACIGWLPPAVQCRAEDDDDLILRWTWTPTACLYSLLYVRSIGLAPPGGMLSPPRSCPACIILVIPASFSLARRRAMEYGGDLFFLSHG